MQIRTKLLKLPTSCFYLKENLEYFALNILMNILTTLEMCGGERSELRLPRRSKCISCVGSLVREQSEISEKKKEKRAKKRQKLSKWISFIYFHQIPDEFCFRFI